MFNIIDIIGLIIVAVCGIIAFKNGFVKTFFGFISAFLALVLAFVFCNLGVEIIKENTGIDEWLQNTISASLNKTNENTEIDDIEYDENISATEKNALTETLENLPQNIKDIVGLEEQKEVAQKAIIEKSTDIILKILSWIIIYLVVRIVLMVVCFIFNGIMNIPFLKQINNVTGLFLGIILGLFRIYVILAFISFLVLICAPSYQISPDVGL